MAVWPVAAFFLGGLATQLTGWLTHRRQQKERQQDAAAALHERRETFELEHLQRLNEALQVLSRATAQAHHADMMASRETRLYGGEMLPDELDEALRVANQDVYMLAGLVLDDELREQVKAARSSLNQLAGMIRVDPSEADAVFMAGYQEVWETQDRIAARIREIYLSSASDLTPARRA
ncbi:MULTISPECIES: hypothetical protein [unclassified Streptomyces]|uniref:hypothetical protein n=1 Tax=unclassified Streptomyces TaxID=2593676 RepID=UPI0006AFEB4A|nr:MULTISPECIES: hypothetical protein [unclassified Streptomyces]KOX34269.1 hypothetical protein ADL06_07705 [Streptomyces sp. NRRL F-6491]KOX42303.1 hypothetical protein ADL08_16465 [Streptomyces sp. NRRL F-6492]